ncbi:S8 family serine peptidase, partial [Flavobacterium sp.]|uniref:S8 family serine peptidase n=1 Tax=Flavobacterium sp. TaxID=239 RepID=UPI00286CE6C4
MKKNFLKILFISSLIFTSCTKDETNNDLVVVDATQKEALKASEINAKIEGIASSNNIFNWNQVSDQVLWSAALQGQNLMTIGFGNTINDFDRSKLSNNQSIQKELFDIIERYEGKKIKDILVSTDVYLNLFDVQIEKQETIIALKRSKALRYIEPADYRYLENNADYQRQKSSSGCGYETATLASSDYTTITPNAKVPWAFYQHNIPAAWNVSTGAGVTIGVVDTGLSGNQGLMGSSFNNGQSSGRSVQRFGTFVDSFWPWSTTTDGINDKCGHGTSMSSVATSPRNDKGLPVGVAYNANLITYRASSDVLLEGYHEQNGVKNAFTGLANNANVKIISMSMGYIFSVGKIEDGIRYAHSKGK